jgi:hypothetical protein
MPPSTRLHRHSSLRLLALLAFATVTLHAVNAPLVNAVAAAPHYTFLFVHGAWGGGWQFARVDRLLTADPGKKPEEDRFFRFYERAKARGWATFIMEADHNPQWFKPKELAKLLEKALSIGERKSENRGKLLPPGS